MSLRARLAVAFALVVLVPLTCAAAVLAWAVPHELSARVSGRLDAAAQTVAAVVSSSCSDMQLAAVEGGAEVMAGHGVAALDRARQRHGAAVVAVLAPNPVPQAPPPPLVAGSLPGAAGDAAVLARLAGTADCSGGIAPDLVVGRVGLDDGRAVVAAEPVAPTLLTRLRAATGSSVTVASPAPPGPVVATTLTDAAAALRVARAALAAPGRPASASGQLLVSRSAGAPGVPLLFVVSDRPKSATPLLVVTGLAVLVAVAVAGLLGLLLARLVTRPLLEHGGVAQQIAAGRLDTELAVAGPVEVATLARAFAGMTAELRSSLRTVEASRDELRRNLERLGNTLSGTHDLDRILEVIVDTALASVRAGAAVVLLGSPGSDLTPMATRGLEGRIARGAVLRVRPGVGVLGRVFATGEPACGEVGEGPGQLRLDPGEPTARCLVAVPLKPSGRTAGVLALYDREDGRPFDAADLDTLRTFAAQAGVAIDNVLLHQEAQRLSITDGLTGLWNYRYLSMALAREVERATRFGRPLAVLMLDLDRFKSVNDLHGHQRGDAVLVEVASRVGSVIREVDVLARYGGEELVLVLPETDLAGAEQTARRVADVVRGEPYGQPGEVAIRVTVSTGVAVHPQHGSSAAALLRAADEALYEAKRAGRDRWRIARAAGGPGDGGSDPGKVPDEPAVLPFPDDLPPARRAPGRDSWPDGPG